MNYLLICRFHCDVYIKNFLTIISIEALYKEYDLIWYSHKEHNYSRFYIPLPICQSSKQDIFQLYIFCTSVVFLNVCSFLPLF